MNPKLLEAVAIFKELGWENVTADNILTLPLGTKEQRQIALSGLKSGDFGEIKRLNSNTYGWVSVVDVDESKLALFAVRIGVNSRRAANILHRSEHELLVQLIAERGVKYASDFIRFSCVSKRRMWEHSASKFGNVAVRLVDRLNLDIPQSVEYMKDWSAYAAAALGLKAEVFCNKADLPGLDLIERRFREHVVTGVAVGVPATGPFGALLPIGVKRGWLPHESALELTFTALDAAVRPADRKVWLNVLDELEVTAEQLCARTQALIPLLAAGEATPIIKLAPTLLAGAKDDLLVEVLLASLSATTKKAKQTVLKSALDRPRPQNAEDLTPWLSLLASDADKGISSLAARILKKWNLTAEAFPDEKAEIQELWQETPALWHPPAFDLGEISPEALTELTAQLLHRPAIIHDVMTERFLAVLNAVARENPEAARTSLRGLRGLRPGDSPLLTFVVSWVKGETATYGFDHEKYVPPPLTARDYVVSLKLSELPCLLSTPSYDDLSISVADLASRLALYQEAGVDIQEADLLVALTRLNGNTKTPEAIEALKKLNAPILLQSGKKLPKPAGEIVSLYLNNPIREPLIAMNKYHHWSNEIIVMPKSLREFPNRFDQYLDELFSVFPLWGDASLRAVRWNSEVYHEKGLILRQVARRANPLPPGASINLFAAQRSTTPDAATDSMLAVAEAWERGLLRPGVPDVGLLDWSASPPSNLAALALALDGIARGGLLSVVWPILDELVAASLKAPRLLAGTAELAELIFSLLPEVQTAVAQGKAASTSLELPGIRKLAERGGSSRAVSAAKQISALLPVAQSPEEQRYAASEMNPPFDEVWSAKKSASSPIEDGVGIRVDWAYPNAVNIQKQFFLFTLTLPNISDRVFQIVNRGWHYDLEREGQCQAYAVPPETTAFVDRKESQVYLHWDEQTQHMTVCDKRNWSGKTDGPLSGVQAPPLSASLLTVIVGLLAQNGDAVYYAPRLLTRFIENGQIGEEMIRRATLVLLQNPVVSPAKLVRVLEKDIKLLPVMWPMLTESVKAGGELSVNDKPPVWINRILDIALRYAPFLREAANRGFIPEADAQWSGLSEIAASKAKSSAVKKAKRLMTSLGID